MPEPKESNESNLKKSAIELLERARGKPLEDEEWTREYVTNMIEFVIKKRLALEAVIKAQEIERKKNQGWFAPLGNIFRGESEESVRLREKNAKDFKNIKDKEEEIRNSYKEESCRRELSKNKIAKAFEGIPGFDKMAIEQKLGFLKYASDHEEYKTENRYDSISGYAKNILDKFPKSETISEEVRKDLLNNIELLQKKLMLHLYHYYQEPSFYNSREMLWYPETHATYFGKIFKLFKDIFQGEEWGGLKAEMMEGREKIKSAIIKPKVEEIIAQNVGFKEMPEKLQKELKAEVSNAVMNEERPKEKTSILLKDPKSLEDINRENKIKSELEEIQNFKKMDNETKKEYVTKISNQVKILGEAQKNEDKNLEAKSKENIINEIKKIFGDFNKKDETFEVVKYPGQALWKELTDKFKGWWEHPGTQSAVAGGIMGAVMGSAVPLYGTVSLGIIGAALGFKYPGVRYLLEPFTYLVKEIFDIATKPKAYIDRIFRGSMIAGSAAGTILGIALVTTALGLSNPFTAGFTLGGLLAIVGVVIVASMTARFAKWVSAKVAEKRYTFANPDRYELTKKALEIVFDSDLEKGKKIRDYFKNEIKSLQTNIKADIKNDPKEDNRNNSSLKSLFELESIWDKVRNGEKKEFLIDFNNYTRRVYQQKRKDYIDTVEKKIETHREEITKVLLDVSKFGGGELGSQKRIIDIVEPKPEKSNLKPIQQTSDEKKGPKELFFSSQAHHTLKEIHDLEEIYLSLNPTLKPKP